MQSSGCEHIKKKRYAYLEVGNVGNSRLFREKKRNGFSRLAWAAITIFSE